MRNPRLLIVLAAFGCSTVLASAADDLARVWSAPNISVRQRAAAVNRAFTNGTPIHEVIAALGTNYSPSLGVPNLRMGTMAMERRTWELLYRFDNEWVSVGTSAFVEQDAQAAEFVSAGYISPGEHSVFAAANGPIETLNRAAWSTNEHNSKWVTTNDNWIEYHFHGSTLDTNAYTRRVIKLPFMYRDSSSGLLLYVESDGRHITAITPEGNLLWCRDPFADAKLSFYRTLTPRIVFIEPRATNGVLITFDSSQFGVLDPMTGDFAFLGQR